MPYGTVWSNSLDRNLPDGERIRYSVVAVDKEGNALDRTSADVPVVEVPELVMAPAEPTPEDGSPFDCMQADAEVPCGTVCLTSLRWDYEPEDDPRGAATGFHIYRWNPATGTYDRLTDAPLDTRRYSYTGPGGASPAPRRTTGSRPCTRTGRSPCPSAPTG